eukprot:TRINITY_DN287_c0_g1_i1.p2 TRINITY_DN287_c0_g1~~TRINITY_DN287_c0_g1_i1.p2  ORF type:complete len:571 (+),score=94.50 TRINITY_DN287_c0_g1_i1:2400-4112(+)
MATHLFLACSLLLPAIISIALAQSSQSSQQCEAPSSHVTGFSVFYSRPEDVNAFLQDFNGLVEASRAEPGTILYNMYTTPTQPGLVGFVESYKDFEALGKHLASEHVTSIFTHQYYNELRTKPADLYGPWIEVPVANQACAADQPESTQEPIEMVFYWVMNCTRQTVWDVITDWEDASWGLGHPETTMVPLDEHGQIMSDEEAAQVPRPLDVQGGLGPVAQRRIWDNGNVVDVRMLARNDSNFTTVQQTLSLTSFAGVTFDDYFVTMSLDAEGLDADLQSRMRYHIKATTKDGNNDEARLALKNNFYGPRIDYYQVYFNCTKGINMKRAESTVQSLHDALRAAPENRSAMMHGLFDADFDFAAYIERTIGDIEVDAQIDVKLPAKIFATVDLRVVATEDIVITTIASTTLESRIVIYQLNEWGRIVSTRIFDDAASTCHGKRCKRLIRSTGQYFKALEKGNAKKMEKLFAKNGKVEIPVSFAPADQSVESTYKRFFESAESFEYEQSESRCFVDAKERESAQLIDVTFTYADGGTSKAAHVEIIRFDGDWDITSLESFYEPKDLVYASLE